jgi:hypothetical protein
MLTGFDGVAGHAGLEGACTVNGIASGNSHIGEQREQRAPHCEND